MKQCIKYSILSLFIKLIIIKIFENFNVILKNDIRKNRRLKILSCQRALVILTLADDKGSLREQKRCSARLDPATDFKNYFLYY